MRGCRERGRRASQKLCRAGGGGLQWHWMPQGSAGCFYKPSSALLQEREEIGTFQGNMAQTKTQSKGTSFSKKELSFPWHKVCYARAHPHIINSKSH